jgi:putative endonuclease
MPWFIYILLCDHKSYYVGLSGDLRKRLASHKAKHNLGTKEFQTIDLVYCETNPTRKQAEVRETQIKKWSKAKKKALIEGKFKLLKKLSKS